MTQAAGPGVSVPGALLAFVRVGLRCAVRAASATPATRRRRILVGVVACLTAVLVLPFTLVAAGAATPRRAPGPLASASASASASQCDLARTGDCTFGYTGAPVDYVIPPGVSAITLIVTGGQGGSPGAGNGGPGGPGAEEIATLPVSAGVALELFVGGQGGSSGGWGFADGGDRGTSTRGNDGSGGGGASAVLAGLGRAVTVVAGGGGGGGGDASGDLGGAGGSGAPPQVNGSDGQAAPDCGPGPPCRPGTGGAGGGASSPVGASGDSDLIESAGGGGGGGFGHGGAGGGVGYSGGEGFVVPTAGGGGGGGGNSFVGSGASTVLQTSVAGGDGSIEISTNVQVASFSCPGTPSWTVPPNVSRVRFIAIGARGGVPTHGGNPGLGAQVTGVLEVPDNAHALGITVGCNGDTGNGTGYGPGGARGSASLPDSYQGGGGGGGTAVTAMVAGQTTPLVVAGGGGGGGGGSDQGGGNGGNAGYGPGISGAGDGQPGSGSYGGHPGQGGASTTINGGDGGDSTFGGGGAGGGGGYPTGGSGGSHGGLSSGGGGGGGGSSDVDQTFVSQAQYAVSGDFGNGQVVLIYAPDIPSHLTITAGSGQHAVIDTRFSQPLSARVTGQFGQPIRDVTVTFVNPSSGATASFGNGGSQIDQATTNDNGVATSSALTANGTVGAWTGKVEMPDAQLAAGYSLDNDQAPTQFSSLTSSPDPSVVGQQVAVSATVVASVSGPPTPTGLVQFTLDGSPLGSPVALDAHGKAISPTVSIPAAGRHIFGARYQGSANFEPSDAPPDPQLVLAAPTSTAISSSTNPSLPGQAVTFSAVVSATPPGSGTVHGGVQFALDGQPLGPAQPLAGGAATSPPLPALPPGSYAVTAIYAGNTNYQTSSASLSQAVQKAASVTASTPGLPSVVFGQPNHDAATVSGTVAAGSPTGTVEFFQCPPAANLPPGCTHGGTGVGSAVTVPASANQATATSPATAPATLGSWCYRAQYQGSDIYLPSTDQSATECFAVTPAATITTISAAPPSPVFPQAVTLQAHINVVAPGAGAPAGTVNFYDGAALVGQAPLSSSQTATLVTAALAVGPHHLSATYTGATDFTGSSSPVQNLTVAPAPTATSLRADPTRAVFRQPVLLTARVASANPTAGVPTGTVTFSTGPLLGSARPAAGVATLSTGPLRLGSAPLDAGVATLSTTRLARGTHTITARYSGDPRHRPSTATTITHTLNPSRPAAALTVHKHVSRARAYPGQRLTYTITVHNAGPAAAADVTVTDAPNLPLKIVSIDAGHDHCTTGKTITCRLGTIAARRTDQIRIVAIAKHAGTERNTATAHTSTHLVHSHTRSTATTRVAAILRLQKRALQQTAKTGQNVTYQITVSDPTLVAVGHVKVCDPLPHGLGFLHATPHASARTGSPCWQLTRLAAHSVRTLTVLTNAEPGVHGRLVNTAHASAPRVRRVTAKAAITVTATPKTPCFTRSGTTASNTPGSGQHQPVAHQAC